MKNLSLSLRAAIAAGLVAGTATILLASTAGVAGIRLASTTGDVTTTTVVEGPTTTTTAVPETTTTTVVDDTTTTSTIAEEEPPPPVTTESRTVEALGLGTVSVTRVGKVLTLDGYTTANGATATVKKASGNQVALEFTSATKRVKVQTHATPHELKVNVVELGGKHKAKGKAPAPVAAADVASSPTESKNKPGKGNDASRGKH